jgi:hypothetical protein
MVPIPADPQWVLEDEKVAMAHISLFRIPAEEAFWFFF